MFVKNFYVLLAANCFAQNDSANVMKNCVGTNVATSYNHLPGNIAFGSNTTNNWFPSMYNYGLCGVAFGTGTTPVTFDDYTLSGTVIEGYTCAVSVTKTADADGMSITGKYTITNTSESEFTIGEVALRCYYNGTSGPSNRIMIERTVLDNPVTIPAGGFGQVTYTIRLDYPTA